jgi:hypothetical protein
MLKKILPILAALAILLTACGTPAPPTMSPADVQGTAVSAAWTMVAATQAAIPTNTPLPPTETASPTPLPTFTPELLIPTLPLVIPTATTVAAASDPNDCTRALNMAEAGPTHRVRIENESPGTVNLSLNLWKPNLFGQCGAISFANIKRGTKTIITIPAGYWFAYAWVLDPPSNGSVNFYLGPSKSQDLNRMVIKKDIIAWVGP